jgi:hypothetical protein
VWELPIWGTSWGGAPIIGDSIVACFNSYDDRIYAIGKGPSATTVSVQNDVIVHGSSVLIKGTVTDESAGAKGTPAIADESMSEWMKYIYMQFPRPTNATGVPITLSVLDANGNYREIGTTTSDSSGLFSYLWQPDITGKYTVFASFDGSKSYWPSSAETAFGVDEAPEVPPEDETPTQTAATFPIEGMYALTGIFIAVIAVLGFLLYRKK